MVSEGQAAPNFTLSDQDGNAVTLSELKGQPIILYFYPRDQTPGCTTEACGFRDAHPDYQAAGAKVLGVSPDTVASHRKFAAKHGLPFTLLADPDKAACQAYGVWKEKTLYGKKSMGMERATFLIDADGAVRKIFRKVKVDGHIEQVLAALRSL